MLLTVCNAPHHYIFFRSCSHIFLQVFFFFFFFSFSFSFALLIYLFSWQTYQKKITCMKKGNAYIPMAKRHQKNEKQKRINLRRKEMTFPQCSNTSQPQGPTRKSAFPCFLPVLTAPTTVCALETSTVRLRRTAVAVVLLVFLTLFLHKLLLAWFKQYPFSFFFSV